MKGNMFKKIAFLSALLLLGSGSVANVANAADVDVNQKSFQDEISKKYYVRDFFELSIAVNKAQDGDEIVLKNDISLENKIVIKSSICLNLDDHSIFVKSDKAGIVIGDKKFDHLENYTIKHPGEYRWEPTEKTVFIPSRNEIDSNGEPVFIPAKTVKVIKNKRVWYPERNETCTREVYTYRDDIAVMMKNGRVLKSKGQDGRDGIEDSEDSYNGEDGKTPNAPVEVLSGTLRLNGMRLRGGNGGDGGRGGYQRLVHFIFGGGDAGKGGDGAKGGYALYIHRKGRCSVVLDKYTDLKAGKSGRGGKAGEVNPGYWLYSGCEAKDGKNGEESPACN